LSLRRTNVYASFLGFRKPCIWSFLLCHRCGENLPVHICGEKTDLLPPKSDCITES